MKRLRRIKRIVESMQRLIERELTVDLIGEEVVSFLSGDDSCDVRQQMETKFFDVCGVGDRSGVIGFVERTDLKSGVVGLHSKPIPPEHMVGHADPLWDALPKIAQKAWLFMDGRSGVKEIVTIADLNKQPARLLMFGCVSTLEMTMLEQIRRHYNGDGLSPPLSITRLEKAKELQKERRRKNQDIDLVDCLQLCDKARVCLNTSEIRECWGWSETKGKRFFENLASGYSCLM